MSNKKFSKNLFVIGISLIFSLAGDQTLYVVLPVLAANSLYPLAKVGVLLSANRFVRLLSNSLVGSWLHQRRRKPYFLAGLLIGACTPLLYIMGIETYWIFVGARALWGIAFSLLFISSVTMVMDMTDHSNHGWGSGLLQVFYFLGLALTPLLGGLLTDWFGFRVSLAIASGLGWLAFILSMIFIEEDHDPLVRIDHTTDVISKTPGLSIQNLFSKIKTSFQVLKGETIALLFVYMLSAFITEGVITATLSLYFVDQFGNNISIYGISIQAASIGGAALAYRSAISAGFAPWFGRLSDRFENGWIGIWIASMLGIFGMAVLAWIHHPFVLLVGLFLIAVSSGFIFTGTPALIARIDRNHQSILIGWMATAVDIGLTLAPLICYAILGWFPVQVLYMMAVGLALTSLPVSSRFAILRKRALSGG